MSQLELFEVSPPVFDELRWLFAGFDHVLAIRAALGGSSKGKLFVDDQARPSVAILWNAFDGFYIELSESASAEKVRGYLERILEQNRALAEELSQFIIYVDLAKPDAFVQELIPTQTFDKRWVKLFRRADVVTGEVALPADYTAVSIAQLLNAPAGYLHADEIRDGILQTWVSVDAFLEKGFGVCLLDSGRRALASLCFTEHVSETGAELSVETFEEYRRSGLGYLSGCLALEMCQQRGLMPHWYCMADNHGSIALAEKLGMRESLTFPVWFFTYAA